MRSIIVALLLTSYALSQCQVNPAPNTSDPFDPKTVCIGPLGTTGPNPGSYRFKIGGTDPSPQVGYVWISVGTGKVMESDNGGPYHSLVGPQGISGLTGATGVAGKDGINGLNGKDGSPATIQIGTTTTVQPGAQATITNTGTASNAILNFTVPQGPQGLPGKDATVSNLTCVVNNITFSPTTVSLSCH